MPVFPVAVGIMAAALLGVVVDWLLRRWLPERATTMHVLAAIVAAAALVILSVWASGFERLVPTDEVSQSSLQATSLALITELATAQAQSLTGVPSIGPTLTAVAEQLALVEGTRQALAQAPTPLTTIAPTLLPTLISPLDGMALVPIPSGQFLRGASPEHLALMFNLCPACDRQTVGDQVPARYIHLDSFWIDQTEVTTAQFAMFVAQTGYVTTAERLGGGSEFRIDLGWRSSPGANWRNAAPLTDPEGSTYPVSQVSWHDAAAYCAWVGRRLPTEAEWEKAARGIDGRLFPWGNVPPDSALLNYNALAAGPTRVGSYPEGASPYGALDMSGNLWEWVADFYSETYYDSSPDSNPAGSESGDGHTMRGGSWASQGDTEMVFLTTTFRLWNRPDVRSNVLGFRCATEAP